MWETKGGGQRQGSSRILNSTTEPNILKSSTTYIRFQQKKKKIAATYIGTEDQTVDIFTKPLVAERDEQLKKVLGIIEVLTQTAQFRL